MDFLSFNTCAGRETKKYLLLIIIVAYCYDKFIHLSLTTENVTFSTVSLSTKLVTKT